MPSETTQEICENMQQLQVPKKRFKSTKAELERRRTLVAQLWTRCISADEMHQILTAPRGENGERPALVPYRYTINTLYRDIAAVRDDIIESFQKERASIIGHSFAEWKDITAENWRRFMRQPRKDESPSEVDRRQEDALDRALKIAMAKARIFILSNRAEFMTPLSAPGGLAAHWRSLSGDELVDLEVEELNASGNNESAGASPAPIPPGVGYAKPPAKRSQTEALPVPDRVQRPRAHARN